MPFSFRTFFPTSPIVLRVRDHLLMCMFYDKKGVIVSREIELPKGIIVGGIVRDVARFHEALNEMLGVDVKAHTGGGVHKVFLVVPDMYVYTHVFTVSRVATKELPALLYKSVGDFFPLPIAELLLDWSILPAAEKEVNTRVFVSAVRKDHFASMYEALRESNCSMQVAENESISLARALLPDHLFVTAIIDIDTATTNVAIFDDATLLPKVTLSIPIGDDALTSALCERQKIDIAEAVRMKHEEGFDTTKGEGWTIVVLQERVQAIIHEIEKGFAYYERSSGKSVHRIILCGVGAVIPQLDTYLGVNLKSSIAVGDPFRDVAVAPTLPKNRLPVLYSALFGLYRREAVLRSSEGKINFVSHFIPTRVPVVVVRSERFWRNCALATFFLSILLSGLLLYQTLVAPKIRYDHERSHRIAPLVPFDEPPKENTPVGKDMENETMVSTSSLLEISTSTEIFFASSTDVDNMPVATTSETTE